MNDIFNQLKPWLAWLHVHPNWVGAATFIIAFIECLAVVGLLVPGSVLMTAIGALIGTDVVSAQTVFIPAIIGAICGDALSYFIGGYYHEHLRDLWPFKFYPRLLQKSESFFYRHGGKGVFVGRFLGPIRPMLPIIAGMLNMPAWRFFIADITSAIFWAPLYMLPGILLGAASVELAPGIAMHLMLYVILALLFLWCISWLIKRFVSWVFTTVHNALDSLWDVIKHKPLLRPLSIALQDPLHPESHAQLTLGLYCIFFTVLFFALADNVLHHGVFTNWNQSLLFLLRSLRNNITDHIMVVFTLVGETKVLAVAFVAVLLWLMWKRAWRTVVHWLILGAACYGGGELIKHLIHSPRPAGLVVTPSGFSFPSGHTTVTATIGGFFAVLVARELKKGQRWIPYTIIASLFLCVGFSRLYLGAHWLTDVIGGLLFASMVVTMVTLSYRRQATPTLSPLALSVVFSLAWFVAAIAFGITHYKIYLHDYTIYIPAKTVNMDAWWQQEGTEEPLFRLDRTGKPSQALNVQWAGNLSDIEESLISQGWTTTPNTTLSVILSRISKQSNTLELPVLPQLYLDQRPVLVMTKSLESPHSLLVLSLWDGKTTFSDSNLPLWLGNVSYYHLWQSGLFHLHPAQVILPAQSAMVTLEMDLNNFTWKQVAYPLPSYLVAARLEWDGQVLLVKPANEEEG